jgi:O-acetylserine/cysteine efflux transporter
MKKIDLLLGIFVTGIWGANFSVIKLGLDTLDPFLLTSIRFALCAIPLIFFIKKPNVRLSIVALYGFLFGVGLWGVVNLGIYWGLSAGLASLILQFSAFFTIVLAALTFGEKISKFQIAGISVALTGLVLILTVTGGNVSKIGAALVILGALCWSGCNIIVRKNKPENMLAFIVWSSMFSAIPLFLITYLVKGSQPFYSLPQTINNTAIFSILFQSYITTIFGYWVWNSLMKKYPVSSVAPLSLFVPVSGLITSWLVFDEHIGMGKIIAALLILSGMTIFLYAKSIDGYFRNRVSGPCSITEKM